MRNHGYQNYFDNEVLAASPLRLIQMLYSAALDSIAAARGFLRLGDIRRRSRAITRAMRIVTELSRCLNHDLGGDLSRNLARVYGYVLRLLIDANAEQTERPLAEADSLLSTLAEAWTACLSVLPEHEFPESEPLHDVATSDSSIAVR